MTLSQSGKVWVTDASFLFLRSATPISTVGDFASFLSPDFR
jgi:hypothetical protein